MDLFLLVSSHDIWSAFSLSPFRFYHKIGTPQADDILIYLDTANPTHSPSADVSDDGKYIILTISKDCDPVNKLFIVDLEAHNHVVSKDFNINKVVDNFKAEYD